jgi:hypothetical protein
MGMLGRIAGTDSTGTVCAASPDKQYVVMQCDRSAAISGARTVWSVISMQRAWDGFHGPWHGALTVLGPGQVRDGDNRVLFIHVHATFWCRSDAEKLLTCVPLDN